MIQGLNVSAFSAGWLEDASPFTAVATATIALGQAKNMMDNRRKRDDA